MVAIHKNRKLIPFSELFALISRELCSVQRISVGQQLLISNSVSSRRLSLEF